MSAVEKIKVKESSKFLEIANNNHVIELIKKGNVNEVIEILSSVPLYSRCLVFPKGVFNVYKNADLILYAARDGILSNLQSIIISNENAFRYACLAGLEKDAFRIWKLDGEVTDEFVEETVLPEARLQKYDEVIELVDRIKRNSGMFNLEKVQDLIDSMDMDENLEDQKDLIDKKNNEEKEPQAEEQIGNSGDEKDDNLNDEKIDNVVEQIDKFDQNNVDQIEENAHRHQDLAEIQKIEENAKIGDSDVEGDPISVDGPSYLNYYTIAAGLAFVVCVSSFLLSRRKKR